MQQKDNINHADDCPCSLCEAKRENITTEDATESVCPELIVEPQKYIPPYNAKNIKELNEKVEYYYKQLNTKIELITQPIKPFIKSKPKIKLQKPFYKRIGFYALLIICFLIVYGLYLFYMAEQGKRIILPF